MYIAARSEDRAKAAIEDFKQTIGKEAIWLKLDLSSLKSVKAAAEEFLECVRDEALTVKVQLMLQSGKNQNSMFFSTMRVFYSLTVRIGLSLL